MFVKKSVNSWANDQECYFFIAHIYDHYKNIKEYSVLQCEHSDDGQI